MPLKTLFVTFCLIFNVFFLFRYEERLAVSVTNLAKTSLEADKLQKVKKSREFELISTSNFRGYRMRDCKKNWIDQYIKLKSSGIIHHQQLITPQTENEEAQACAKQSEENDSLEQQLKDAQYTLTESENK